MRDDKTLFLFVFSDRYLTGKDPSNDDERKLALKKVFADIEWECPQILEAMEHTQDIYFDNVSQIRMENWTKRRCALIGDAAACVSLLAGEGSGLAMAEAYVLAGELQRSKGDLAAAFASYQALMKQFLERKQRSAARFASTFAPQTALGISFRNLATQLLRIPIVANFTLGRSLLDDIELPDYRI